MRPVTTPAFLHALSLLLLLATYGCGPAFASRVWWYSSHVVHLYTADQRRSFHLQINPNGRVDGTPSQTIYSAVIRKTLNPLGHISIVGVKTRFYLCMQSNGQLFASLYSSSGGCVFRTMWLENNYEVYESTKYKFLVSLGSDKGKLGPNWNLPDFSQFLPRMNEIPLNQLT